MEALWLIAESYPNARKSQRKRTSQTASSLAWR